MSESSTRFRPEIQGLRAVAVLVVLVFHVWPAVLPGGYVGVDVFFVISGYLITGMLLNEAEARGTLSLARFYTRRIKRLLPASSFVLLAAAVASAALPPDQLSETAAELAASALYVQNWWLAGRARDYLAADDDPSILQHFWSLSVEEQYYIVWPLLFLAVCKLSARARSRPRAVFGGLVIAIFAGSLAYSIHATSAEAGSAYFSTATRAWELAIGGALAVFPGWSALKEPLRAFAGLLGLCAIGLASYRFGTDTVFPGYAALLPTLGAALILISGSAQRRFSADALLASRPMQYLGDISYSLYLWHWLVVVVYGERADRELGFFDGVLVISLSISLAHASKLLIEDPFRTPEFVSRTRWQPFAFGAACIASSLGAAGVVYAIDRGLDGPARPTQALLGARALHDPHYDWTAERLDMIVPSPARALRDLPRAYKQGCMARFRGDEVEVCTYGPKQAELEVVLIGDSHVAHWFPAFEEIAERRSIRVKGLAKSDCGFSFEALYARSLGRPYTECVQWSHNVVEWLKREHPDLVLVAASQRRRIAPSAGESQIDVVGEGMAKAWRAVQAIGLRLAAFETTPWFPEKVSDCLSSAKGSQRACALPRSRVIDDDPVDVAAKLTGVPRLDVTDAFCVGKICPPVIGGVLIYRDAHHITATYSRTLADDVERALEPLLGRPQ